MTEFDDRTRGGHEFVIYDRWGPDDRMFGRIRRDDHWRAWSWNLDGHTYAGMQNEYDLIPRITVSEAVMAAARHELDTGASLRHAITAALSIARDEWEAGR